MVRSFRNQRSITAINFEWRVKSIEYSAVKREASPMFTQFELFADEVHLPLEEYTFIFSLSTGNGVELKEQRRDIPAEKISVRSRPPLPSTYLFARKSISSKFAPLLSRPHSAP